MKSTVDLPTWEELTDIRYTLNTAIDKELSRTTSDALFLALRRVKADLNADINTRLEQSARIIYQVAGQRAGNDDDFGEATTTALRARTEDAFIARYRPMYIRQTGQATGAGCIARADFEARQRAARTDETTYVVQGWRQGNGTLWQPNHATGKWPGVEWLDIGAHRCRY